tara:strand:+ start:360 stop:929 length:570 start_codon:yes stop_codon:yes gene_type:complete
MVRSRGIENIEKDLTGNLQQDFNIFIRAVLFDLSNQGSEKYSPVDTGFFVSSWTAGTQRPRPNEARESVAPWSNIKPTRTGNQNNPQAVIEPRFINTIKYNFKIFSKVYIGNRSQYAARALGSSNSQIPQYVQGKLSKRINQIFTDKKPRFGVATFGTGVRGDSSNVRDLNGFGLFGGGNDGFVDYTDP